MNAHRSLILTALMLSASLTVFAEADTRHGRLNSNAHTCYAETLKAQRVAPEELELKACNRALNFQPLSNNERSIVLHNRGIIELAKGMTDAARASFERSVALSNKVDMRNLALAQLAHKQGDYLIALEQYDALINSPDALPNLEIMATVQRNRDRAVDGLQTGATSGAVAAQSVR